MHDCPQCGQACDCDGDDTYCMSNEWVWENCEHDCGPEDDDDLSESEYEHD